MIKTFFYLKKVYLFKKEFILILIPALVVQVINILSRHEVRFNQM